MTQSTETPGHTPRPVLIRYCSGCGHAFVQRRRRDKSSSAPPESISADSPKVMVLRTPRSWATSATCPHCHHSETSIVDTASSMILGIERARQLSALTRGSAAETVSLAAESADTLPAVDPALLRDQAAS